MKGFPKLFKSRADLDVGMDYVKRYPQCGGRMVRVLEQILGSAKVRRLKPSVEKKMAALKEGDVYIPADSDFEWVEVEDNLMSRLGLTADEVQAMIGEVQGYGY